MTDATMAFEATLDRDPLLAMIGRVRSVVERSTTIPILRNLRLTAGAGTLSATGTDLDLEIRESMPCSGAGDITVDAELLGGLLQKIPTGAECSLRYGGDDPRLTLKAGRSNYNLPVLPPGDFPCMSVEGLGPEIALDTSTFATLLEKTAFAISTEETRYYLNGAFLHPMVVEGVRSLRAVATDGHRLALADMDAPDDLFDAGVIVPRKTVREINRLIAVAGETVWLRIIPGKLQFRAGNAVLTSKVIDGNFPPYERVIPKDNPHTVRIDRGLLTSCMERALVMSRERAKSIRLDIEAGKILLTIKNMEAGQGAEEIEADYDGEPISIGFNGGYILDVLGQVEADQVEFRVGAGALDPVLVLDPDNAKTRFVVMPLRA